MIIFDREEHLLNETIQQSLLFLQGYTESKGRYVLINNRIYLA